MFRLLAFALFVASVVLIIQAVMLHMSAERLKSLGIGLLALVLIGVGLAMIVSGM